MLRKIWGGCIAAAILVAVPGCAEINQRGGFIDKIEDRMLFKAETKSHRLLRSYALIGAMTAVARRSRMAEADKIGIGGKLKAALKVADEAYQCLYPKRPTAALPAQFAEFGPNVCIFFDERMARLDYAIYKLAVEVLVDPEGQQLFADLQDKMFGEFPVLGPSVKAAVKVVDAAGDAATATQQATNFVSQLLRFSYSTGGQAIYLLPIYRDILELDMHLLLHVLAHRCGPRTVGVREAAPQPSFGTASVSQTCATLEWGEYIFANGSGNLKLWREFTRSLDGAIFAVEAYPVHFAIVSNWLVQSCTALFNDTAATECVPLIESAVVNGKLAVTLITGPDGRVINASRMRPTRVARPVPAANPLVAGQPVGVSAH